MTRRALLRSVPLVAVAVLGACGPAGGKGATGGPGGSSGGASQAPPAPETSGRVLFVSDSRANDDIYVLDLATGTVTALTRNPSQDLSPAPSPDGSKIAFSSSSLEGHLQIAVMNADGSSMKALTSCKRTACTSDASPAWSPDGRQIAFGRLTPDGRFAVDAIGADGSGQHTLVEGRFAGGASADVVASPSWSPDGKRIAFEKEHRISVVGTDGSGLANLTGSGPGGDFAPAWSPDGRRIAFMSNREGHFKIYAMNADGSGVVRLTADAPGAPASEDANPSWSPGGTKILFSRDEGSDRNVWVMNPDGSGQQQLTLSRSTEDEPAWVPSPR